MKPTRSGYADVNGIRLYHEIYGDESVPQKHIAEFFALLAAV